MAEPLLRAEQHGMVVVVRPAAPGELTAVEAPAFRRECDAALADTRLAVIDLGPLGFLDSSGLAVLVSLHRVLAGRGGQLRLASPGRDVTAVIELARLHRLFEIYDTVPDALDGLADGI